MIFQLKEKVEVRLPWLTVHKKIFFEVNSISYKMQLIDI